MVECKIYICGSSYHVRGNDFVFQAGKGQEEQQMHFSTPKGFKKKNQPRPRGYEGKSFGRHQLLINVRITHVRHLTNLAYISV